MTQQKIMNAPTKTSEFVLLFRGTNWDTGLSPDEMQKIMTRTMAWFDRLGREGRVAGGRPLMNAGRVVSGKGGRAVADGPFAESKEAIGGFLLVKVSDISEAVEIARGAPALEYGMTIEIREAAEECPTFQRAKNQLAAATA